MNVERMEVKDNEPIISGLKAKFFVIRRVISKREFIGLIIIAVLLFFLCLFFGLYVHFQTNKSKTGDKPTVVPSSAEPITDNNSTAPGSKLCMTAGCLAAAANTLSSMNQRVSPCDDFYEYACGSWAKNVLPVSNAKDKSVLSILDNKNYEILEALLEQAPSTLAPWSAERKLKHFYESCTDMFTKMNLTGKELMDKIIIPAGGWSVLPTWNANTWNFQRSFEQTHGPFWTNALINLHYQTDDKGNPIVYLTPGGLGYMMRAGDYNNTKVSNSMKAYRHFMTEIAKLVIEDSKVAGNQTYIDSKVKVFVDDVILVETIIAMIQENKYKTRYQKSVTSLGSLTKLMQNNIDFASLLGAVFPEPAKFTTQTKVILDDPNGLANMGEFITKLKNAGILARVMSNYLTWKLMDGYAIDLGWQYVHTIRTYYHSVTGQANFQGNKRWCSRQMVGLMKHVVSYMFATNTKLPQNKQAAITMLQYVKKGMITSINGLDWMNASIKGMVTKLINSAKEWVAYPDWVTNENKINQHYQKLVITDNALDNVLKMNEYNQNQWADALKNGGDWDFFGPTALDNRIKHYIRDNVLIVSSGFLQSPFFDANYPNYHKFGTLGHMLANEVVSFYVTDLLKVSFAGTRIKEVMACYRNAYGNATEGPFVINGKTYHLKVSSSELHELMVAGVAAAKVMFQSYLHWEEQNGVEKQTPGLTSLTNHQLLFVSMAQAYCQARSPKDMYIRALGGYPPMKSVLNKGLAMVPEFKQAFGCKMGTPMVANADCGIF